MTPASQVVQPGAGVDIEFTVTVADSMFNGFDANVSFDPAALTLVPAAPSSLQQGCLMTGGCSSACGNTFHWLTTATDSMSVTDVLLCAGIAVRGPGQLYKLHFIASNTPQVTQVRFHQLRMYNAGLYVPGVEAQNATVAIGVQLGVPGGQTPPNVPRITAAPNPARGSTFIRVESAAGGDEELFVSDVTGRAVRLLQHGAYPPGTRTVSWDGRDDRGRTVQAGVYFVRFRSAGRLYDARLALLK
jgi:hypothetical protein